MVIERVMELAKTIAQRPAFNLRGIASGISRGLMQPLAPYQAEAVSMPFYIQIAVGINDELACRQITWQ